MSKANRRSMMMKSSSEMTYFRSNLAIKSLSILFEQRREGRIGKIQRTLKQEKIGDIVLPHKRLDTIPAILIKTWIYENDLGVLGREPGCESLHAGIADNHDGFIA